MESNNYHSNFSSLIKKPEMRPETRPAMWPETRPAMWPETRPVMWPEKRPAMWPETRPAIWPETKPEMRPETRPETWSLIILKFILTKDLKGWRMVLGLTKEKDRKEDSENEGMYNNCIELGGGAV